MFEIQLTRGARYSFQSGKNVIFICAACQQAARYLEHRYHISQLQNKVSESHLQLNVSLLRNASARANQGKFKEQKSRLAAKHNL